MSNPAKLEVRNEAGVSGAGEDGEMQPTEGIVTSYVDILCILYMYIYIYHIISVYVDLCTYVSSSKSRHRGGIERGFTPTTLGCVCMNQLDYSSVTLNSDSKNRHRNIWHLGIST